MIKVDLEKATELALRAITMKDSKMFPFDQHDVFPDAIVPENIKEGSKEHAWYLFHAVSMDSMRKASEVYSSARKNIFDEALEENNEKLEREYGGNPINIRSDNIRSTIERIKSFRQFGDNKSALFMKNMVRFGMWDFSPYEIPVKIDRHLKRIALGTGIIDTSEIEFNDFSKYNSKALDNSINSMIENNYFSRKDFEENRVYAIRGSRIEKSLREAFLEICKQEKISAVDLNDVFWAIGSYSCDTNEKYNCDTNCLLRCKNRFPSDSYATYFFKGTDKRKNDLPLFSGI